MLKRSLCICLLSLFLTGCLTVEEGEKIGFINRTASGGLFFITDEGTLRRGGMNDGTGNIGENFNFTIEDKAVLKKLELAMNNGLEVKIKYHYEVFLMPWRGTYNYICDDVEFLSHKELFLTLP